MRALTSKQNSDAFGMHYQWGRKDPFTFATNSEKWKVTSGDCGKYPVKIYTIDGVLIYQDEKGYSNKDKQPVGGVIESLTVATSMMEAIKNPNTLYGGTVVINQVGHTNRLWDYYWTSYSRGTDGNRSNPKWHNNYLSLYTTKHLKSIYDPCPYGYRISSNGTYNQFDQNKGWITSNYAGGIQITINTSVSWLAVDGFRHFNGSLESSYRIVLSTSTPGEFNSGYIIQFFSDRVTSLNRESWYRVYGTPVRCIELVSDDADFKS